MKNKRKLIILSIVAILLIVVLTQASYAYFTTPGSTGSEETISSGTMALSFSDGPQINATNLAPGDYIEKTFSVTNTGTLATTYDVYLSEVVNTFVQKSDLVYELTSNDGGYNTSSEVVVPNQEAKIVDTYSIGVGATHHYTLKITYKLTNQIQNDNMGRGFTAKISINEYNLNSTEKLLKLLDTSGNIVDKQMISSGVTDYYYNLANTSLTGTTNIYCNNGGIPTISNNQLTVSDITVDTECKMSSSINNTITNLPNTKTGIVMTNNNDGVTPLTIASDKEVVLDLNGKNLNSAGINDTNTSYNYDYMMFDIFGDLTINDSIGTGGVYTGASGIALRGNTNGTAVVNGGSYNGKLALTTDGVNSSFTVNGGTFSSISGLNMRMSGKNSRLVINDATINELVAGMAGLQLACANGCTADINGGTYVGNQGAWMLTTSESNKGTLNINGGDFTSNVSSVIGVRSGTININGGNFNDTTTHLISLGSQFTDELNINAGVFNSYGRVINYTCTTCSTGVVNISGGTFNSTNNIAVYTNGEVNIDGGNFTTERSNIIYNEGADSVVNISGGHVYSGSNSGSSVRCQAGALNVTGGFIESYTSNTIYVGNDCTTTINGDSATFDGNGNYLSGLFIHGNNQNKPGSTYPTIFSYGNLTINNATVKTDLAHSCLFNVGELKVTGGTYDTIGLNSMVLTYGHAYISGGTFNGRVYVSTYSDGTYHGSQNYICGGTFNSTVTHIASYDSTAMTKYKSSVVWQGSSSPTITGSYPALVSLDDTIVCSNN